MSGNRREFIKKTLAVSAYALAAAGGWLASFTAEAKWPAENFAPSKLNDKLTHLFKDRKIIETGQIEIKIPKIAENGAVVPLTISSSLADVQALSILVEKNPVPLAARFELAPELDVFVSARIKMAETCNVIVIAETREALYSARELVKVTIGGCGG
jgi:sulfur-oxidizing protein SoxY